MKKEYTCFRCGEKLSPKNNGVVINKGTPHERGFCDDCHFIEFRVHLYYGLLEFKLAAK